MHSAIVGRVQRGHFYSCGILASRIVWRQTSSCSLINCARSSGDEPRITKPSLSSAPDGYTIYWGRPARCRRAPARLSTTTGCPSACESGSAMLRAEMSAAPPAGNGTIILTGLPGYCATAPSGSRNPAASAASNRITFIIPPLVRFVRRCSTLLPRSGKINSWPYRAAARACVPATGPPRPIRQQPAGPRARCPTR